MQCDIAGPSACERCHAPARLRVLSAVADLLICRGCHSVEIAWLRSLSVPHRDRLLVCGRRERLEALGTLFPGRFHQ